MSVLLCCISSSNQEMAFCYVLICKPSLNPFWSQSSRSVSVFVLYRYTVLFSHGNAVDLGQMSSFYIGLGTRINCNIFSYDYSGYGVSTGKPSEKNLYADIDAAWHALRSRYVRIRRLECMQLYWTSGVFCVDLCNHFCVVSGMALALRI